MKMIDWFTLIPWDLLSFFNFEEVSFFQKKRKFPLVKPNLLHFGASCSALVLHLHGCQEALFVFSKTDNNSIYSPDACYLFSTGAVMCFFTTIAFSFYLISFSYSLQCSLLWWAADSEWLIVRNGGLAQLLLRKAHASISLSLYFS